MIDQYRAGHMRINGRGYHKDLKIIRGQIAENWWRKQGHRVDPDDLKDVLKAKPDVLVMGTGYAARMRVSESLRSILSEQNIKLISEDTAKASETFNRLFTSGANVAGAFHLTC